MSGTHEFRHPLEFERPPAPRPALAELCSRTGGVSVDSADLAVPMPHPRHVADRGRRGRAGPTGARPLGGRAPAARSRLCRPRGQRPSVSYEEYHPFGSTAWWATKSGVQVSAKRYRYTGKEKDEETGLSYHGARYYAPWLGRWTAADPAGMVDGPNRYAYVRGRPVGSYDPTGNAEVPSVGYPPPVIYDDEFVGPLPPGARYEAFEGEANLPEPLRKAKEMSLLRLGPAPSIGPSVRDPDSAPSLIESFGARSKAQSDAAFRVGERFANQEVGPFGTLAAVLSAATGRDMLSRDETLRQTAPVDQALLAFATLTSTRSALWSPASPPEHVRSLNARTSPTEGPGRAPRLLTDSRAAQKLLGQPITWQTKDLAKVISKHGPDTSGKGGSLKSRFFHGEDIASLISQGTNQHRSPQRESANYIRTWNVGRNIGVDVNTGEATPLMTVITSPSGRLVTAHPGK